MFDADPWITSQYLFDPNVAPKRGVMNGPGFHQLHGE
jgi:hypothetical protein